MNKFPSKKEALNFLKNSPLSCVLWDEKGITMSAIYWNGKRRIQKADEKIHWPSVK